jgi:hypothetical protein
MSETMEISRKVVISVRITSIDLRQRSESTSRLTDGMSPDLFGMLISYRLHRQLLAQ